MPNVLITGANRGIGLALTQHFTARGDRVIGVCRKSSDALEATGAQVEAGIDVSDEAAVAALAKRIPDARMHLLPGARHAYFEEEREVASAAAISFLAEHRYSSL